METTCNISYALKSNDPCIWPIVNIAIHDVNIKTIIITISAEGQGDDDRAGGWWHVQGKGMMTEQGEDDWQGDDDRAGGWWQIKEKMAGQGDDDRA